MKRSLKTLTLVATIFIAAQTASALTIQDVIDGGGSLTVGNLVFSDFEVMPSSTGGALALGAQHITVTGTTSGTDIGLEFSGGWMANSGQSTDSHIRFKVTAINGVEVTGNNLGISAGGTYGDGMTLITEDVYDGHPLFGGTQFAEKIVGEGNVPAGIGLTDHADFTPSQTEFWVDKDVYLNGGSQGLSHLSGFYQTFETTPEPGTCALLGLGGLTMLYSRKRRKNQV